MPPADNPSSPTGSAQTYHNTPTENEPMDGVQECHIRPPLPLPNQPSGFRRSKIIFKRGSQGEPVRRIISLSAHDGPNGGLHHETARIACAILSNVKDFDACHLSLYRFGPAIDTPHNGLLFEPVYHLVSKESSLCHQFSGRTFPKTCETEPEAVTALSAPDTCVITYRKAAVGAVQLVPASEEKWFDDQSMYQFCVLSVENIFDPANTMRLRCDLQRLMNEARIAIVPKGNPRQWVIHVLEPGLCQDLISRYHNVPIRSLFNCHPAFLLARFALSLFHYNPSDEVRKSQRRIEQARMEEMRKRQKR